MIDLHCHLLPGIDDGAPDMAESMAMLQTAAQDGIETVVCTPHAFDGVFDNNDIEAVTALVAEVQREAVALGIPVRLVPGADVHVHPDIAGLHRERRLPTVGGTRYFLLELPHDLVPLGIEKAIFEWQLAGLCPILTHPERNAELMRDMGRIFDLVRRGVMMQVTAASLTGEFGGEPERVSLAMLEAGCMHFLATDAHSAEWRKPQLTAARERVAELAGPEAARSMVVDRPARVLAGEAIPVPEPDVPEPQPKPWYRFW